MNSLKFSFILLVFLAACRPEAGVTITLPAISGIATPTADSATATAVSTPAEFAPPTPELTPTEAAAAMEAEVMLIPGMTKKYVHQFPGGVEKGTKLVNGQEVEVFYGVVYTEKEPTDADKYVIAMEINGEMLAVSEYKGPGFQNYVYVSPENSIGGRFTVDRQTAKLFFDPTQDPSIWKSISQQKGLTPEDVMKENEGIATIRVPVRDESVGGDFPFRYEQITVNLKLPIEIRLQATAAGFNSLSSEIKTRIVTDRIFFEDGGKFDNETGDLITEDVPFYGSLVWNNPDESLLIVSVGTIADRRPALLNPTLEKNTSMGVLQKKLSDSLTTFVMRAIYFVGKRDISLSTIWTFSTSPYDYFQVTNFPIDTSQ